jgi:hypothetical protein
MNNNPLEENATSYSQPLFPIFSEILAQISDSTYECSKPIDQQVSELYLLNSEREKSLRLLPQIEISIEELKIVEEKLIKLAEIKMEELIKVGNVIDRLNKQIR